MPDLTPDEVRRLVELKELADDNALRTEEEEWELAALERLNLGVTNEYVRSNPLEFGAPLPGWFLEKHPEFDRG